MLIEQNAHQLGDGDGRVRIVELDHLILRQIVDTASGQMVSAQDIGQRAGAVEVLLHQAQPLSRRVIIVGIEYLGQLGSLYALTLGVQKLPAIKAVQVEGVIVAGDPQTQWLADSVTVADHRQIARDAAQG